MLQQGPSSRPGSKEHPQPAMVLQQPPLQLSPQLALQRHQQVQLQQQQQQQQQQPLPQQHLLHHQQPHAYPGVGQQGYLAQAGPPQVLPRPHAPAPLQLWDDGAPIGTSVSRVPPDASPSGGVVHPMTPLGLPATPPALPAFPGFVLTPAVTMPAPAPAPAARAPTAAVTAARAATGPVAAAAPAPAAVAQAPPAGKAEAMSRRPAPPLDGEAMHRPPGTAPKDAKGGDWTPIDSQKSMMKGERRTFFHGEGKQLTHNYIHPKAADESQPVEVGQELVLNVVDIHFGNPRIRIMNKDPAPMPQMLKWPKEKFSEFKLECGQVSFGDKYKVWCAYGITSNRLLYAMKRNMVETANAVIVQPPPPPDPDEEVDLTYGASVQGIQLVP